MHFFGTKVKICLLSSSFGSRSDHSYIYLSLAFNVVILYLCWREISKNFVQVCGLALRHNLLKILKNTHGNVFLFFLSSFTTFQYSAVYIVEKLKFLKSKVTMTQNGWWKPNLWSKNIPMNIILSFTGLQIYKKRKHFSRGVLRKRCFENT